MIKSLIFDHCSATPTCSLTGFCCPVRYPARRLLAARNSIRPLVFPVAVHQPRVPVHKPQLLVWKQVVAYKHLDKLGARKPNEKVLLCLRGVVFLHFALVQPPCLAIVFGCLNLKEPRSSYTVHKLILATNFSAMLNVWRSFCTYHTARLCNFHLAQYEIVTFGYKMGAGPIVEHRVYRCYCISSLLMRYFAFTPSCGALLLAGTKTLWLRLLMSLPVSGCGAPLCALNLRDLSPARSVTSPGKRSQ